MARFPLGFLNLAYTCSVSCITVILHVRMWFVLLLFINFDCSCWSTLSAVLDTFVDLRFANSSFFFSISFPVCFLHAASPKAAHSSAIAVVRLSFCLATQPSFSPFRCENWFWRVVFNFCKFALIHSMPNFLLFESFLLSLWRFSLISHLAVLWSLLWICTCTSCTIPW